MKVLQAGFGIVVLLILCNLTNGQVCPTVTISAPQVLVPGASADKQKIFFGQYIKMWQGWMIVGGYGQDTWKGAGFVYRRNGETWSFRQELRAAERGNFDYFGLNLDITRDATNHIICIGSPFDQPYGKNSGSAHVYDKANGEFTNTQVLTAPGPPTGLGHQGAFFGYAVAADWNYIVIGSRNQNQVDNSGNLLVERAGVVFVFVRPNRSSPYSLSDVIQQNVKAQQFADEVRCVGMKGSNKTIFVGSPRRRPSARGAAHTYRFQGGNWVEEKLFVPDETGARVPTSGYSPHHGEGLAMNNGATRAIIGGERGASDRGSGTGAAYVWDKIGGVWTQTGQLWPDRSVSLSFGQRLGFEEDFAAIGAWGSRENNLPKAGSWYFFVKCSDGSWSRSAKIRALNPASGDNLGKMMDVRDGWVAVGAPKMSTGADPVGVPERGAVYMYKFSVGSSTPDTNLLSFVDEPVRLKRCANKFVTCIPVNYASKLPFRFSCQLLKADDTVLRNKITPLPAFPVGSGQLTTGLPSFSIPYNDITVGETLFLRIQLRKEAGGPVFKQTKAPLVVVPCNFDGSTNYLQT